MRQGQILQSDKVQMFNFWPQNGTEVPLHESDNLLQRPFSAQLQWVEMKQDWSCLEKIQIFHILPQNGTRLPQSTITLLFNESDNFLQSPFCSKPFRAFYLTPSQNPTEIGQKAICKLEKFPLKQALSQRYKDIGKFKKERHID